MTGERSVLFLALGEAEVPAFRKIAEGLAANGVQTSVVTWLPRLSGAGVQSLMKCAGFADDIDDMASVLQSAGIGDPSMAADYDRDWHFASICRKRKHVVRVFSALQRTIRESGATTLVSSIGGETPRIVAEALAQRSGLRRLYFDALPIEGRFVLLPALDASFMPQQHDGRPSPNRRSADPREPVSANATSVGIFNVISEGVRRGAELPGTRGIYPPMWYSVKIARTMRQHILRLVRYRHGPLDLSHQQTRILYPLHDERDFQVAVRERHAVPQESFLLYLSTVLPPGYHLYVKPHPHHRADHHPLLWWRLHRRPNVTFLPMSWSAKDAIRFADVVLTLASSLGFEALLQGRSVVCYGTPFYAGRGLTVDVGDVRELPSALADALDQQPEAAAVRVLVEEMYRRSWPGNFTPLDLSESNLALLGQALHEALS
jgi:capsular polysaccharide export protein